jgi:hypothetical protein
MYIDNIIVQYGVDKEWYKNSEKLYIRLKKQLRKQAFFEIMKKKHLREVKKNKGKKIN